MTDKRQAIVDALADFDGQPLPEAAMRLFETLGYLSDKRLALDGSPDAFLNTFDRPDAPMNRHRAMVDEWQSVDLLFQLTDDELTAQQSMLGLDTGLLKSYLFFAIRLHKPDYSRGKLAAITRSINRIFSIPVLILFAHGDRLSIAIINRRAHKREPTRDVLEKVSLIKDISFLHPHRGHLDVLASFSMADLSRTRPIRSFDALHDAWAERLNIELLNKRFYQRIQEWFFWATQSVGFPHGGIDDEDLRNRIALIRMLTRIIFCWFARQKRLIPPQLFAAETAKRVLKRFDPAAEDDGGFYLAILQNLFFPTLAVPLDQREFRDGNRRKWPNPHYMDHRFYRHEKLFRDPDGFGSLFEHIPFLNGGLFECLDYREKRDNKNVETRVDGFSDIAEKQPLVPNVLFFGEKIPVDLSEALGTKKRDVKVDGLFRILDGYTFTVTENTPVEEEIALDPELLGRIFENLLAEYNPETERTARKETGSFYTPRTIVDYMVSESLKAYLERELIRRVPRCSAADARAGLDLLFAYTEREHPFDDEERRALVDAVYDVRAFDPACGSGAFPMGMLQKLVFVLEKLDRDHHRWKARIIEDTPPAMREDTRALLERSSAEHNWKLALIEHSIYGADIQPIAVQIAKLRCFISLLVDFRVDETEENMGVPSLPNLDFKFVAANSLIPAPGEHTVRDGELALTDAFFDAFAKAAEDYYYVRDPAQKAALREKIEELIDARIAAKEAQLESDKRTLHGDREDVRKELAKRNKAAIGRAEREIALWESYRNLFAFRNAPVQFFDVRYFFPEVKEGFDITIGNPPYVRADEPSAWNRVQREAIMKSEAYETLWEKWDLYVPFIERAYKLLRTGGVSTMIVSDAFCHSKYAQKPQNWFLQNARILRLDFCSDLKIFDAAVHNLIYFFQKAEGAENKPERRLHKGELGKVAKLPTDQQGKLTYRAFFPEKAATDGFPLPTVLLGEICYITIGMVVNAHEQLAPGAFTMEDLVVDAEDAEHPKRFAEGKHLDRWLPAMHRWLEWGTKRAPALFRRKTFPEIYETEAKILVQRSPGHDPKCCLDEQHLHFTESTVAFIAWHILSGVRNRSLKKSARYKDEKPPRRDLPRREDLEATSRRFAVKYLLAVMNSTVAREFLRANRRSNIHLYPDDWKKLPIPDVDARAQAPIVRLVDKILATRRADPAADIADLEKQVDAVVTKLYGIESGATAVPRGSAKTDLKERLRTECIPQLGSRAKYFHTRAVGAWTKAHGLACGDTTLKQYMSELMAGGFVHDAGKGWYSTIKNEFLLDARPVDGVIALLRQKFPLLRFGCWSTEQVARFTQHTQAKFVVFVHTRKDAMKPVFETLRGAGWNAYLNPGAKEARTVFTVRDRTAVVRFSRAPGVLPEDHLLPAEDILVELYRESKRLSLMDLGEVGTVIGRALEAGRLDMGALSVAVAQAKARALGSVISRYTILENR